MNTSSDSYKVMVNKLERIRHTKAAHPAKITNKILQRKKRPILKNKTEKLFIIAADHPARGALSVGNNDMAMGNRFDLINRIAIALQNPQVDGVLATADILEDLIMLDMLEEKIAIGSMNRGGIKGANFEMDDRFTGYSIEKIVQNNIDLAKVLLRINYQDPNTASVLEKTAQVIDEAVNAKIPIILEPFISKWQNGEIVNDLSTEAVIKSINITSGLGANSNYSWLKIPIVEDFEKVMASNTLPTLLLGGEVNPNQEKMFYDWEKALNLSGVTGMVAGRSLLYPPDNDVLNAVNIAANLVHKSKESK